jgi:VPDSG-CTERM motif
MAILTGRRNRMWLLAIAMLAGHAPLHATSLRDKGIYLAGPFETPDIHQPPSASAEAVFLAGSTERAPLFLNELVVASDGSGCAFLNNGWVNDDAFTAHVADGGSTNWISWDLSGTGYALTYVSVNFDNNFYHVYSSDPLFRSEGQVAVTGNLRDVISHIHLFGVSSVPDSATTAVLLGISLAILISFRHHIVGIRVG